MTQKPESHLHVVSDNDEENLLWPSLKNWVDPLFEDPGLKRLDAHRKAQAKERRRDARLSARLPMTWLKGQSGNALLTPAGRLYFYLAIRSRRGKEPVQLTARRANEIGLLRQHKTRYLRLLEGLGLITVDRIDRQVPRVTVHPLIEPRYR